MTVALPGPPRLVFHIGAAVAAGLLLWTFSVPGFVLSAGLAAVTALTLLAWAVRFSMYWSRHRSWSGRFAVAPALVLLAVVLVAAGAPLRERWAMSRSAFDAVVASLPKCGASRA